MARPPKQRCIACQPATAYFKPRGVPLALLDEVTLALDEIEALRLADLECLRQDDIGQRMGVSRQTVSNLLARARRKVADALLNGKALRIEQKRPAEPAPPSMHPSSSLENPA